MTPRAAEEPGAAIEVEGLAKTYGGREVLRGISFRIQPGETFALLGPNGAGKTTTVEIIEGYRRPDGGEVRVLGRDPGRGGRGARDHRSRVGIMLQGGGGIDPRMRAREVLELYGRFHAAPRDASELIALVGLKAVASTRFRRLSGGERQRLGLALALVGRPQVVALDEPTAGMDVEARTETRAILGRLRDEGMTILLTSHDLLDVERVADRIAIIDRGRLVAIGAPADLAASGRPILTFRVAAPLSEPDRGLLDGRIRTLDGRAGLRDEGRGRYRVEGADPTPELIALVASWCGERGVSIVDLRAAGGTLEEHYLELIGATSDEEPAAAEVAEVAET
ncbi:MAG TPA: ABC transporter ATP-binding protein [Candidatus Limnocylindrales bacterium]|nr:ABC transporter ATP-binding protein [Candidatus Limnocylindrales bacterium]